MSAPASDPAVSDIFSELEREHEELLEFVYLSPIGLIELSADGVLGMVNPLAMQLMLQIVRAQAVTNFFTIMESYAPELRNLVESFREPSGTVCENHNIFIGADAANPAAEPKVLNCTLIKLGASRFMAAISDVSRQIEQQRRLKQAETWFASLLDDASDFAVVGLDADGIITSVNSSVLHQTGFSPEQTIGQRFEIFEVAETSSHRISVAAKLDAAHRNGWHLEEGWHNTWGGNRYWCQMLIAIRVDPEIGVATGYTAVLRQVARHDMNTTKLRQMLTTDHLTGATNRSHFYEVAERECLRAIRYVQPLSLLALDIDHFKRINDTHGHGAGDAALKTITDVCMKLLRGVDVFARIGGEEFVVLLPSTGLDGAVMLADRLREMIAGTEICTSGVSFNCTASFGCAALDMNVCTLPALLAAADTALYQAKHDGRNRVVSSGVNIPA